MKILSAEHIYAADQYTIKKQGITSDDLMERAVTQIFNWIHLRMQGAQVKIHLFCGIGNNGGDGVALARHLQEHGYNIGVYIVNYSKTRSNDFLTNLERLKSRKVWPDFLDVDSEFPFIGKDDIVVDAIFGIGLNRPPAVWVVNLMKHIRASGAFVLSIDVPSGLSTDRGIENPDAVVRANYVLSFQAPKLVFFLPETGIYCEQWEVLDIGLDHEFISTLKTGYELIGKIEVLPFYKPRDKFSHKGTYGHSLTIGGSLGKIGAVHLATAGSLHAGCGLATAYVPKCGLVPLQSSLPEAMVLIDEEVSHISKIQYSIEPNAIGIGVGLGKEKATVKAFSEFLANTIIPLVIDADAINILSETKSLLKKIPKRSVLTPHPKELERLIGTWKDDFEKLKKAKVFSKKYHLILVIKGAHTIVVDGTNCYVNTTGNPGMATAGSGDVLTGVITGLIAQHYEPLQAAIFGVYLHGRAGDMAIEATGYQTLVASDLLKALGKAYLDLFKLPDVVQEEPQEEKTDQ